jgi:prolyl-tRNA synthetase
MVKGEYSSYKDFPVSLYQIQTKYRDEARPRAGILRGREFVMKDSYSFDLDDAGLQKSYDTHRDAYIQIFDRLGLKYRIVSAVSGAMGGSASEEFLAPAAAGEDTFVSCTHCDYAANTEAVTAALPLTDTPNTPIMREVTTPNTPTINSLVDYLNGVPELAGQQINASDLLKNVLVTLVSPTGESELVAVGVPGDREVDVKRLEAAVAPCEVRMVEAAEFTSRPYLVRGYIGPQGLAEHGIRYLADPRVAEGTAWITGANRADHHAINVTCGRDFYVDEYVEAANVRDGDPCPKCGEGLSIDRGIEIGHIFQLGRKYADIAELDASGPDGKPIRITMGSYGIGISRLVAVLVEQGHDDKGILWPREVAPADVHIVAAGKNGQVAAALQLAQQFHARGVRTLVDDRETVSVGVKFADADLLGIPQILVVGRGLPEGKLELKNRASGERQEIDLEQALDFVAAKL